MDENTIFQTPRPPAPVLQQPVVKIPVSSQPQQLKPPPPPGAPPQSPFPPKQQGGDVFSKLITAIIILIPIIGVLFLGFVFFRSSFFKHKEETVTLKYWGLWEDEPTIKAVVSDFEKQNPRIKIHYEKQDIKGYRERVQTQIRSGIGPDIFRFHNTWLTMFSGYVSTIPTSVIQNKEFQSTYYPTAQKDLVKNGGIYGIPLEIDTLALFTNTQIFKAAGEKTPTTWEEFNIIARKLTVKDADSRVKTAGAALGTYNNITHASDIISMLFIQNGANIKDLAKTEDNANDTLSFYSTFAIGDDKVWDDTLDPSITAFSKGSLAMYFGYSWDIFLIKALNPSLSFEVHPVPHLKDRNATVASYWVEGVSAKSRHQKEAMLFLKFLTHKETAQKLFAEESKTRLFGEPYSRVDLADSLKDNTLVYPFVDGGKNAQSSFFASDTFDNGLNTEANSYLANAVNSIIINTSPKTAIETLSKGITQVLQKYGAL